jgi:hypothetical protein
MSSTAFAPSRPTTPLGREVYDRGVSAVLAEIADTLDSFLLTTPPGREPAPPSWNGFNERLRMLADEARGIEVGTK